MPRGTKINGVPGMLQWKKTWRVNWTASEGTTSKRIKYWIDMCCSLLFYCSCVDSIWSDIVSFAYQNMVRSVPDLSCCSLTLQYSNQIKNWLLLGWSNLGSFYCSRKNLTPTVIFYLHRSNRIWNIAELELLNPHFTAMSVRNAFTLAL